MKLSSSTVCALALVMASGGVMAASCKEDAQQQWPRLAVRSDLPMDAKSVAQLDEIRSLLRQAQSLCNARDESGAQTKLAQVKAELSALGR